MEAISVNDLAPYPKSFEEVTAERLARHLTVSAMRSHRRVGSGKQLDSAARARCADEWSMAFLLREMQERAGVRAADMVARTLWMGWEDGGHYGEVLTEWLDEYDINPDDITAQTSMYTAPEVA